MSGTGRCAALRDALTEVALGVADGPTRGAVLAHLATCDRCRDELSSLAAAADELLLLAPEREPAAGFEGRVLARLAPGPEVRRHRAHGAHGQSHDPSRGQSQRRAPRRVPRGIVAAALGAALLGAGGAGVWVATAPDRELAEAYRTTLDTADGRYLAAADLVTNPGGDAGRSVGTVFLYEGDPAWAYVVVRDAGPATAYTVTATVGATREVVLGTCAVTAGACTAGGLLDAPVHDVAEVRLTSPDGTLWATAVPAYRPAR